LLQRKGRADSDAPATGQVRMRLTCGLRNSFERIFDVAHAVAYPEVGFHFVGDEAELPVVVTNGNLPHVARGGLALDALRAVASET